jgi:LacI family transcriptional regulator
VCAPPDTALVEQLTLEMANERYRVLVCSSDCRSPDSAEEIASLARVVPIDGAILCAPLSEQLALGAAFQAQEIPCVRIGATGRHGVCADEREAARKVTAYLISLGHARIAFVCGPREHDSAQQRRQGFLDGMQIAGLPPDPEHILRGAASFDDGVDCGRLLLRDMTRRPSAIFASTDLVAAGILAAAHELGIPVPDALSVVGFGDQDIARQVWPTLTSVRPPTHLLAARAATLLLELLKGAEAGDQAPLPSAQIIVRNSTGARQSVDSHAAEIS